MTPPVEWPESVVEAAMIHGDMERAKRRVRVADRKADARVDEHVWFWGALRSPAVQEHIVALLAQARRDGAEEMRERAAALIACGCKNRRDVVMQPPNSAARWSLCAHPSCMAVEAAAIRALTINEGDE